MGNAEPLGQSLSLCSLAGARSADQQQAHLITRVSDRSAASSAVSNSTPSASKSSPVIRSTFAQSQP
jgi:hypothetical protein